MGSWETLKSLFKFVSENKNSYTFELSDETKFICSLSQQHFMIRECFKSPHSLPLENICWEYSLTSKNYIAMKTFKPDLRRFLQSFFSYFLSYRFKTATLRFKILWNTPLHHLLFHRNHCSIANCLRMKQLWTGEGVIRPNYFKVYIWDWCYLLY